MYDLYTFTVTDGNYQLSYIIPNTVKPHINEQLQDRSNSPLK